MKLTTLKEIVTEAEAKVADVTIHPEARDHYHHLIVRTRAEIAEMTAGSVAELEDDDYPYCAVA